jgi:hypothetical protein
VRLDHLLSKEHNTSTRPGYPDQPWWSGHGLAIKCIAAVLAQGIVELLVMVILGRQCLG